MSNSTAKQAADMLGLFRRRLEQQLRIPPRDGMWGRLQFWSRQQRQKARNEFKVQMRIRYVLNQTHKLIYCPIEKNACSFFKRTLIEHSECCAEWRESGLDVHTFLKQRRKLRLLNERQIRDASFLRFVIVREPVERIVSAYLNKFVRNRDFEMAQRAAEQYASLGRVPVEPNRLMTFRQFVDFLGTQADSELDNHWRSQVSFLSQVVDCFDWIVPMHRIVEFIPVLERRMAAELPRQKTRNRNVYHSFGAERQMYDWYPDQLRELSDGDIYPDVASLAPPELMKSVAQRFRTDVEFYELACQHFELKIGSEPQLPQTSL